jgi:hypothetical protein
MCTFIEVSQQAKTWIGAEDWVGHAMLFCGNEIKGNYWKK